MESNVTSADFLVGSTQNGTTTTIAGILGTALNIRSGTNTIKIYSDGGSNAKMVKFNVGANVQTYMASGKTTIDGGQVWAGSNIKIGNMDGASDYCSITKGEITFYKYFSTIGHKQTKSLKRLEIGTATTGVEKEIPGYWASKPQIFVSPLSIQTYVKDASAQDQVLSCPQPTPYKKSEGKWAFVPNIMLIVSGLSGMGNYMPINYYTNYDIDWGSIVSSPDFSSIHYGDEYEITESNIIGMNVNFGVQAGYMRTYQRVSTEDTQYLIYALKFYVRVGYYITNTWYATDWVLFQPDYDDLNNSSNYEGMDSWGWALAFKNISIPEQEAEINKIRIEIQPYDGDLGSCGLDVWFSNGYEQPAITKRIESILKGYTATYGSDSVNIEGDVNYIAISEG